MWCVSLPLDKSLDLISVWSILIGEHMRDHLRAFYSQLKSKVGNILAKAAALRIDLKIDGAPIASRSHTHPALSTLSPFLLVPPFGIPFPLHPVCIGIGGLRGPMHLCACVSEERSNGRVRARKRYLCCQIQSSGSTKAHTP